MLTLSPLSYPQPLLLCPHLHMHTTQISLPGWPNITHRRLRTFSGFQFQIPEAESHLGSERQDIWASREVPFELTAWKRAWKFSKANLGSGSTMSPLIYGSADVEWFSPKHRHHGCCLSVRLDTTLDFQSIYKGLLHPHHRFFPTTWKATFKHPSATCKVHSLLTRFLPEHRISSHVKLFQKLFPPEKQLQTHGQTDYWTYIFGP